MSHIFISYSRSDIAFAGKIVQALADNNLDTWIDWKSIPKGEDWEQEIYRGIEEADAFLFLISPDSAASQMCNKEIAHAVKNSKRILPIVIHDADLKNIHPEISKRNWIFCRDGKDDFNKAIEETRKTIHTDYEWLKYHTELQVKALKWEQKKDTSRLLRGKELREAEQQLAEISSQEDPQPTKLQREYILISQRNEVRTRRQITIGLVAGLAIMVVLSFVALGQRNEAKSQQAAAQAASTRAIAQESIAKTNEAEAVRQANIALARQLAAQAQSIIATKNSKQIIADLLATESLKIFPSNEASQVLMNNNYAAHTVAYMKYVSYVNSVAFSPDGKYVVSGGCDEGNNITPDCYQSSARVLEVSSGREVARMRHGNLATSVAFSPNGRYVASSGCDIREEDSIKYSCAQGSALVLDMLTGTEISITYTDLVDLITFSPDGKYLIFSTCNIKNAVDFACVQGVVHVWDYLRRNEISQILHNSLINSFAISPDGKYIVIGGGKSARVWDMLNNKEVAKVTHEDNVYSVAFSFDSNYVASGSADGVVLIKDIITNKEVVDIHQNKGNLSGFIAVPSVLRVVFSPNGKYIVTAGIDGVARVWDVSTGNEVAHMTHDSLVSTIVFSSDGSLIVSGSADNTARVWETVTGKEVARMTHDGFVTSVAFSPDGKFVASSGDNTVRVWEIYTGNEVFPQSEDFVTSLSFSPNGKYAASGYWDTTIRVWNIEKKSEIIRMNGGISGQSVVYSPNGKYIASKGLDTHTHVWEAETGSEVLKIAHTVDGPYYQFAFNPDGTLLATVGCDIRDNSGYCVTGSARLWEIKSGREVAHLSQNDNVISVAFSPDGKYVILGGADGFARVWEILTGKEITYLAHDENVLSVAFSPDGKYIVSGGDNTARVWEALTGKEIARMTHYDNVLSVAFSPDGKYVVSGGNDNTARVWEALTGKEIARMTHDNLVSSVAFSPDGVYIASGSYDNTARIWIALTGKEVARMTIDEGVISVAFSPNGKYMVSRSRKGNAHAWLWRAEDLILNSCAFLPRNLTHAEWKQYIGDVLPYQAVCPNLPIEPEVIITPTP